MPVDSLPLELSVSFSRTVMLLLIIISSTVEAYLPPITSPTGFSQCPPTDVSVDGSCFPLVHLNELCAISQQCQGELQCIQGRCRQIGQNFGFEGSSCTNPRDTVEYDRMTGQEIDCIVRPCSAGFVCEYSTISSGYRCCGHYREDLDYNYGEVKMYPGTDLPLACEAVNSCLFVDTPNCVYSERYRSKVCCSTWNC